MAAQSVAAQSLDRDRHVRRSGDDYAQAFLTLLPSGQAWPKWPGSTLERTVTGLATYYGFVDGRAADLLERESDPRKTIELLRDWEIAFGLPDPCFQEPLTVADRQRVLVQRITLLGAQSRAWFIEVAHWLGYSVRVTEHAPWMCGISRCGETPDQEAMPRWEIAAPEIRFYWEMHVDGMRLTWFRAGLGECGVDHHLEIGLATDLECVIRRWKPAHTELIFDYSGIGVSGESSTEFAISAGIKIFVTGIKLGFGNNMRVRISSTRVSDAWMEGQVLSYDGDLLTVDVDVISRELGTYDDWSINSLSTAQQGGSMAGTGWIPPETPVAPLPLPLCSGAFGAAELRDSLTISGNIVPDDAATTAWVAGVVAIAGTVSATRKAFVKNLIVGLKADGVWAQLDRLWLLAAENSQSARIDIVTANAATAVNTPTFTTDRGYTGNGTSAYLDSNINLATGTPAYAQDSACVFAWNNTAGGDNKALVGVTTQDVHIAPRRVDDSLAHWNINDITTHTIAADGATGLYLVNRTSSTSATFDKNGSQIASIATASIAVVSANLRALTGAGTFTVRQISCFGLGGGLTPTQRTALYTRLRTYMTAVGVP